MKKKILYAKNVAKLKKITLKVHLSSLPQKKTKFVKESWLKKEKQQYLN